MALIQCPECKREISDKVKACPHCGFPFENKTVQQVDISSLSIASQNPAKTKQIVAGIIIAAFVLVLGFAIFNVIKNYKEKKEFNTYVDNLNITHDLMLEGAGKAEALLNLTGRVWFNSIYEERDPETDKYTRINGYSFNSDFNISLGALLKDSSTKVAILKIEQNQLLVESMMTYLQNPPFGLEYCYDTVTELYSVYKGLTDLAINPNGSLQSFTDNKSQKIDRFMELYNKLKTQIPQKK